MGDQYGPPLTAPLSPNLDLALEPAGALAVTVPRRAGLFGGQNVLTSGSLYLTAIPLPEGLTVGHIMFMSSVTAASGPTHWWFGLYDASLVQLAVTADQLTAAWAASTQKSLAIATTAAGAATTFKTTYSGLHYVGIMVAAGTVPNLQAVGGGGGAGGISPFRAGNADTAQTTPPAFPHTAGTFVGSGNIPWAILSA